MSAGWTAAGFLDSRPATAPAALPVITPAPYWRAPTQPVAVPTAAAAAAPSASPLALQLPPRDYESAGGERCADRAAVEHRSAGVKAQVWSGNDNVGFRPKRFQKASDGAKRRRTIECNRLAFKAWQGNLFEANGSIF